MNKVKISRLSILSVLSLAVSFGAVAQEPKDGSWRSLNLNAPTGTALYSVTDSAAGNCAFSYVDITGTGAMVFSGDDVSSGSLAMGGTGVQLYGNTFTNMVMASNGYLSSDITDGGPDLSNDCPLPAVPSTGGGDRVYPMHDDLVSDGYYQYFATCPRPSDRQPASGAGCHVFQWDNVIHFGGAEPPWGFEAIVYEGTAEFVMQHLAGNPEEGSGSTTGMQDLAASDGTTYACDTAVSVQASTAQCFFDPAVTGVTYTVPTLNSVGVWLLAVLGMLAGLVAVRRRRMRH